MAKNQFLDNARSVARSLAARQFSEGGIKTAEDEEFDFGEYFISNKQERLNIEFTKISDAFSREIAEKVDYDEFLELKLILDDIREQLPYANEDNYRLLEERIVYLQLLTGVRVSFYSAYMRTIQKLSMGIDLSRYASSRPDYEQPIAAESIKKPKEDRPQIKKQRRKRNETDEPKKKGIDDAELREKYFIIFDRKKKGPRS